MLARRGRPEKILTVAEFLGTPFCFGRTPAPAADAGSRSPLLPFLRDMRPAALLACALLAVLPGGRLRGAPLAPAGQSEAAKIQALLAAVGRAKFTFVRNGSAYTATQAREHLEFKLSRAGGRIRTARDFIRHIASKSSFSGRPYLIRFPDGRELPAAQWLHGELRRIEATH